MSLINQMLKDLESRREPEPPAGGVLPSGTTTGAKALRPLTLVLGLLVALLSLALAYALWPKNSPSVPTAAKPPQTVVAAAPKALPAQPASTKLQPSAPTPAVTQVPRQAAVAITPASVLTPPLPPKGRLGSVTPMVIDGGWQPRTLTLRGEALEPSQRIIVNWGDKEKILPAERVEWVDEGTVRIRLVTGNSDEIWQVSLLHPDGSRSQPVEFEVIASPDDNDKDEGAAAGGEIEKVILPLNATEQAEQLYQQGYRALQQRHSERAEALWRQALSTSAQHIRSREGLAALYLSQARKVESTKLLEEGLNLHPENGRLALLLARLLAEQGDNSRAIYTLEQAMGSSGQAELFALAAALYQQREDYRKSISAYQRALQLQPQQSHWWMGLGISLEGDGKQSEAKTAYTEALKRGMLDGQPKSYVMQRLQALP